LVEGKSERGIDIVDEKSNSFGFFIEMVNEGFMSQSRFYLKKCKRIQIDLLNKRSNYFIMVYRSMCSCFEFGKIEN